MGPAGTNISIERDVFPLLVDHGLYGFPTSAYWLDIGTPERYLQATADILEGRFRTDVAPRAQGGDAVVADGAVIQGQTVLGPGVQVAEGAHVESSVLLDGVRVGARTRVSASIVASGVEIGEDCRIEDGVVIGERAQIGPGNVLRAGARIFPGVRLRETVIRS
jgi:mannose-1-phosphate guanylyltransferase